MSDWPVNSASGCHRQSHSTHSQPETNVRVGSPAATTSRLCTTTSIDPHSGHSEISPWIMLDHLGADLLWVPTTYTSISAPILRVCDGRSQACRSCSVEGRLLLSCDLLGRQAVPAVSAPCDGTRYGFVSGRFLLWKREQDDPPRCTARANDHAARNYPLSPRGVRLSALASSGRRWMPRVYWS